MVWVTDQSKLSQLSSFRADNKERRIGKPIVYFLIPLFLCNEGFLNRRSTMKTNPTIFDSKAYFPIETNQWEMPLKHQCQWKLNQWEL